MIGPGPGNRRVTRWERTDRTPSTWPRLRRLGAAGIERQKAAQGVGPILGGVEQGQIVEGEVTDEAPSPLAMRSALERLRAGQRLARRGDPADHPDAADRATLLAGEVRGVAAERQAQGQVTVGAQGFDVEPSQARWPGRRVAVTQREEDLAAEIARARGLAAALLAGARATAGAVPLAARDEALAALDRVECALARGVGEMVGPVERGDSCRSRSSSPVPTTELTA